MQVIEQHPFGTVLCNLLTPHTDKFDLTADIVHDLSGDMPFVRHDVMAHKSGEDWFLFSIILVPSDQSVGIWTREMMSKNQGPLDTERTYRFDPTTFDQWLDGWFENAVLEELTKP